MKTNKSEKKEILHSITSTKSQCKYNWIICCKLVPIQVYTPVYTIQVPHMFSHCQYNQMF